MISSYVDDILENLLKRLGVEMPAYASENDPTKQQFCELEWTIPSDSIKSLEKVYNDKVKAAKKRKSASTEESDEKVDKKKVKADTQKLDVDDTYIENKDHYGEKTEIKVEREETTNGSTTPSDDTKVEGDEQQTTDDHSNRRI